MNNAEAMRTIYSGVAWALEHRADVMGVPDDKPGEYKSMAEKKQMAESVAATKAHCRTLRDRCFDKAKEYRAAA